MPPQQQHKSQGSIAKFGWSVPMLSTSVIPAHVSTHPCTDDACAVHRANTESSHCRLQLCPIQHPA
eukprot:2552394-Alexandrium_andersonii.AAC.1